MSLLYTCDNCGKSYDATIEFRVVKVGMQSINKAADPCQECLDAAEEARVEALVKRKKK
jgi:hypothetical protein